MGVWYQPSLPGGIINSGTKCILLCYIFTTETVE